MRFNGIYTPVITPLHDDFSIDKEALTRWIEGLLGAGVHGIVLAGTTGEYYAHTVEERIDLMHLVREVVDDRAKLVVGVTALRTEDSIIYAEAAANAGADAILLGSPSYVQPIERELAQHALAVDRAAGLPIMLYNYPGRTGASMGPAFLDRVGASTNFCGIKESSGDINRLHMLARDYPHIQLACGMDDQALEFFAWGAKSWVCAGSNFLPQEHIALYQACVVEGDFAKGRRIMSAMLPLMQLLERGGKFVQSIKHGCVLGGLPRGTVRKPLRELTKDERRRLENVVSTLRTTVAEITQEGGEQRGSNVVTLNA
jgi:4-hydroxy-tetrahydrodipicolinate synthase